jgi:thiosulfate dehydrogenase
MKFFLTAFLFLILISNYCYPNQDSLNLKKYPIGSKINNEIEAETLIDKIEKRKIQPWIEPNQNHIPKGNDGDLIRYRI